MRECAGNGIESSNNLRLVCRTRKENNAITRGSGENNGEWIDLRSVLRLVLLIVKRVLVVRLFAFVEGFWRKLKQGWPRRMHSKMGFNACILLLRDCACSLLS